jgi:hypothetical protein
MFYEFSKSEKHVNIYELNPEVKFQFVTLTSSSAFLNNNSYTAQNLRNDQTSLFELNIDRNSNSIIYPFVNKNTYNNLLSFSTDDYNNTSVGDIITGSYQKFIGLTHEFMDYTNKYKYFSLFNLCKSMRIDTPIYDFKSYILFSNSDYYFSTYMIDRDLFGSSIEPKSTIVSIEINIENETSEMDLPDGYYKFEASDLYGNGRLYATSGSYYSNFPTDKNHVYVGDIIYQHGIIIFHDNTLGFGNNGNLPNEDSEPYTWRKFGKLLEPNLNNYKREIKFNIEYKATSKVPSLTVFCSAKKNHLNHSNNLTSLDKNQNLDIKSSTVIGFTENTQLTIKNNIDDSLLVKTHQVYLGDEDDLDDITFSRFEKSTFLSEIMMYDENMEVIAICKIACPIKKKEQDELIFKLKLDL